MDAYIIDRESDTPLYIQIRDNIAAAIGAGDLQPGDKLPPVAALAKEIGVTQATIRRALKDLGKAGHTACHVGRGTFIQDAKASPSHETEGEDLEGLPIRRSPAKHGPGQTEANPLEFAARRLRYGVSKALFDIMPLAHKEGIIQLTKGVPDPGLLPEDFLKELAWEALQTTGNDYMEATDTQGMIELRTEIAHRFSQGGAPVTPDHVLITNGSLQALNLVAQAALENRPGILCETPCFQGIVNCFTALGHWVETVPRDDQGPSMGALQRLTTKAPQFLYLCSYAHNPTGTDLSADRAEQLAAWARQTGNTLIVDEIFRDLDYQGSPAPSLFDSMGGEHAIVISSLSKTIATGLRIGWLIGSPARVKQLAELRRTRDHCSPTLIQAMALTLLTSGRYDAHTEKMRVLYQRRMDTLVRAMKTHMPEGVSWTRPAGGFSILVELPKGYSSVALLLSAIDKGVSFLPGPLFDIDQRYVNALRLSVAWSDEHQIKEGIELLASAIDDFIRQPPGDSGLSGLGHFQ